MQYADIIVKKYLQFAQPPKGVAKGFENYQDPTYLGFYFYISDTSFATSEYLTNAGSFEDDYGGLFRPISDVNSAAFYLKSRGEVKRSEMLVEFIDKFKVLVNEYPWYLLTVAGVGELWKFDPKVSFRAKDRKLTFTTLESIDLRMTYLLDLYRKATYDTQYMRYMLPENLRYFEAKLVIAEIRNIQVPGAGDGNTTPQNETLTNRYPDLTMDKTAQALLNGTSAKEIAGSFPGKATWNDATSSAKDKLIGSPSGGGSDFPLSLKSFDQLATFLTFNLSKCEFSVYDEAPAYLESLANTGGAGATNGFSIKINHISEKHSYGLLGAVLTDTKLNADRREPIIRNTIPNGDGSDKGENPNGTLYVSDTKKARNDGVNDVTQAKRQEEIKAANAKNPIFGGGLLGAAAEGAATNLLAQASNQLGKIVKGQTLGNAYEGSISTTLGALSSGNIVQAARDLISKSTSPALANSLLKNVTLESPLINKEVSPLQVPSSANSFSDNSAVPSRDLIRDNGSTSGDTDGGNNAVFVVTGTEPSVNLIGNPGNVPLIGPSSSSLSPTNVGLLGNGDLNGNPGSVPLIGTGSINGNPGKTTLEGTGQLEGDPGSTQLTGDGDLKGNPGNVQLEGTGQLEGNPGKEELIGTGQLEGNPGKEELKGIGSINGDPGKTILVSPNINLVGSTGKTKLTGDGTTDGNPGKETLVGDGKLEGDPGKTELTGDGTTDGNPGKETLVGDGKLEGDPGKTELSGEGKLIGKLDKVKLSGEGKLEGALQSVSLTGTGSLDGETGKTTLDGAPVSSSSITKVDLTGDGDTNGNPGAVKLSGPDTNIIGQLGKEKLEGEIKNLVTRGLGVIQQEGSGSLKGNPGSVKFTGNESTLEGNPGKESLIAPTINNDITTKEELTAPPTSKEIQGNVKLTGPPKTPMNDRAGNANLTGPDVELTRESLGNSNPKLNTDNNEPV